jgi:uncharacterized protein
MGVGRSDGTTVGPRWLHRKHNHGPEPHEEARRVLSIDGGGIRGIIPAMVLAEIERRTAKPACELFDLIAGTSTGGILAMGLVTPGPDGKPAFKASDGVGIYEEHGPTIFSRSKRDMLHSLGGVLHERYHADGLVGLLQKTFGNLRLSDALTDVLLASYEISRSETWLFRSRQAKEDSSYDFLMWEAVRATTAAPTFFEPFQVRDPNGREHVFVDGAVYANSPGLLAFGEIERHYFGKDILVASLGAGGMTRHFEYSEVKEWGAAHWARPMFEIVLDGAAETGERVMGELLGPERYFRFQQELTEASFSLDNVKPANLTALQREGMRLIREKSEDLDRLCELLVR